MNGLENLITHLLKLKDSLDDKTEDGTNLFNCMVECHKVIVANDDCPKLRDHFEQRLQDEGVVHEAALIGHLSQVCLSRTLQVMRGNLVYGMGKSEDA